RLREGPVGHQLLSFTDADRRGRRGVGELIPAPHHATLLELARDLLVLLVDRVPLLVRDRRPLLLRGVDQQDVAHPQPPLLLATPRRPSTLDDERRTPIPTSG